MMRKQFILIILIIGLYNSLSAQISIGINGALVTSDFNGSFIKNKTGGKIGVTIDYDINQQFVILSGLEGIIKGGNGIWSHTAYNSEMKAVDIQLAYMQIPLSIGYKFTIKENIKLIPHIGAYFAYGLRGHAEVKAMSFDAELIYRYIQNEWNPFKEGKFNDWSRTHIAAFDRFDWGARLGLNIEIKQFIFLTDYDFGLKSVWSSYPNTGESLRNRSFMVGIGYKF